MQHTLSNANPLDAKGLTISHKQGQHDLLALHQRNPDRYPFLLESVASSTDQSNSSRFDILFAFPQETLTLSSEYTLSGIKGISGNDFLNNLNHWWQSTRDTSISCEYLPFYGGWFIYLGYELAKQIEPSLNLKHSPIVNAYATRIPAAIIYDHHNDITYTVCEENFDYHQQLIHDIGEQRSSLVHSAIKLSHVDEEDEQQYLTSIKKVKQYIYDGDIFQANLSRLWKVTECNADDTAIYNKLRQTNPAPFAGLARHNNFSVISSSPERLISVKNGLAQTRPIAGTRRREKEKHKDEALKSELIAHPKERAEHIMLIDLERNDLGRICTPGSIKVDELMILESYAHVHHIVSNVCGQLKTGVLPGDVIRAVFPGGTITGCPKVRCMEIIAELEQQARGAYTGSMGYLNHNGDMDINILIRTIMLEKNTLSFRAGAGLVADSIAEDELEETRHKARGMLLALQE